MTKNKLPFTAEQINILIAAGWIKGTECGFAHHEGFVKDAAAKGRFFSLTHKKGGLFTIATIQGNVCEYSTIVTIAQASKY